MEGKFVRVLLRIGIYGSKLCIGSTYLESILSRVWYLRVFWCLYLIVGVFGMFIIYNIWGYSVRIWISRR